MKKIAILQSNYIPWKGVFDMINMVDEFVFLEDVDYTRRDWRNRNIIPTFNGNTWLTVPVKKAPIGTKIKDINISTDTDWQKKHLSAIVNAYRKAPFIIKYRPILEDFYITHHWNNLSEMNIYTTCKLASILGISTRFINSKDITTAGKKDDKLIEICKFLNATHYLSGPAAKCYINTDKFKKNGITLSYMLYDNYPEYNQLYGKFNHHVSVLDVLFNCGDEAPHYIFTGREETIT